MKITKLKKCIIVTTKLYSFVKLYLKNPKRSSFLSEWAKKKKKKKKNRFKWFPTPKERRGKKKKEIFCPNIFIFSWLTLGYFCLFFSVSHYELSSSHKWHLSGVWESNSLSKANDSLIPNSIRVHQSLPHSSSWWANADKIDW